MDKDVAENLESRKATKDTAKNDSFKDWLKNKKTIGLLLIAALTNIGNVLSTIDIITDKTSSLYTWFGESKKFEGHWSKGSEAQPYENVRQVHFLTIITYTMPLICPKVGKT